MCDKYFSDLFSQEINLNPNDKQGTHHCSVSKTDHNYNNVYLVSLSNQTSAIYALKYEVLIAKALLLGRKKSMVT